MNNTVYCLRKNVGYLCYSPHHLNNALLAFFRTGNSLLKLEIYWNPSG